ncbi:MAG: hypothetical protein KKE23_01965 [Nanoarchaeota archaeon]|nr:hypothetical protein [Nanoarchaeota archaeon]
MARENKMQNNGENIPNNASKNLKKPKNQVIYKVAGLLLGLYVCTIFAIIIADVKIVWLPQDVIKSAVEDIRYYIAHPAKSVPEASALSSELPVEGFVEEQFIPILELINREPQFKYLVDMVVKYKIPIVLGDATMGTPGYGGERARYDYRCPGSPIGKISVHPSLANTDANILVLAGILVHELSHAYNRINISDYYCIGKEYVSDELSVRKNEYVFMYQYDHNMFFGPYPHGMIDLRGNIHDYCIYRHIKEQEGYSTFIDDLNLTPGPNEEIICSIV